MCPSVPPSRFFIHEETALLSRFKKLFNQLKPASDITAFLPTFMFRNPVYSRSIAPIMLKLASKYSEFLSPQSLLS